MERFEATIVANEGGGAYVVVPSDVVTRLGGRGRIPVAATFDGVEYRGSIVSMGGDGRVLGVLASIRAQIGKGPGDCVGVTVEVDTLERTAVAPDDLARALDAAGVGALFDALSYSHRREYVMWIDEAKRPATRARRVAQTVARITDESAGRP